MLVPYVLSRPPQEGCAPARHSRSSTSSSNSSVSHPRQLITRKLEIRISEALDPEYIRTQDYNTMGRADSLSEMRDGRCSYATYHAFENDQRRPVYRYPNSSAIRQQQQPVPSAKRKVPQSKSYYVNSRDART